VVRGNLFRVSDSSSDYGHDYMEEVFSGRNPDVWHFRIFGAFIYCHVSKGSRKKVESTTKLGVNVGYGETPHKYCVYFTSMIMTTE